MARVKVKQLESGSELSEDVVAPNGRLLLKAGTVVNGRYLEVLRTWGVVEVVIVGDDSAEGEGQISIDSLPEEIRQAVTARIDRLFALNDREHPLVRELVAFQSDRLARGLLQGEAE